MKTMFLASTALAFGVLAGAANAATTVYGEGSSLATPTYNAEFGVYNPTNTAINLNEKSTSSGKGQAALLTNTGTASSGVPAGQTVYWAASDSYVDSSFQASWNSSDLATNGQFIQIPMLGTPIAIPFKNNVNTVYAPANALNVATTLVLTDADVCGIFSGKITNWANTAGGSFEHAAGAITVNYRADNSGTSFLFTQHLAKVCTAGTDGGVFTGKAPSQTFANFFGGTPVVSGKTTSIDPTRIPVGAKFVGNSGSGGVAGAINGQASAIGYLSPDFTGVASAPAVTYALPVASMTNAQSKRNYQPTIGATTIALANAGAGSTNPLAPTTLAAAQNQLSWVPALPIVNDGYPIVGYTNWLLPTCFKTPAIASALQGFLFKHFTGQYNTQISSGGFTTVNYNNYNAAIKNNFLTDQTGYHLTIQSVRVCGGSGYVGR